MNFSEFSHGKFEMLFIVAWLSRLKYTSNGPNQRGSNGTVCSALLPGIDADQTCARQERDLRAFAKKTGYKVAGVWKETGSGTKDERAERKKVLALAQARNIDTILVTELTRWGRSMLDLFHTLQDLQAWGASLVAQTGLQFDLRTAQGKLIASLSFSHGSAGGV
jgi:Resolvase, N terminal domain